MSIPATALPPSEPTAYQMEYTYQEAARLLGISYPQIRRLCDWNWGEKQIRTVGDRKAKRIPHGELVRYCQRRLAEAGIESENTAPQTKKEASPLARKRTQTRNLRSSAKNKSQHGQSLR